MDPTALQVCKILWRINIGKQGGIVLLHPDDLILQRMHKAFATPLRIESFQRLEMPSWP